VDLLCEGVGGTGVLAGTNSCLYVFMIEGRWVREAWITERGVGGDWPVSVGRGVFKDRLERRDERQSGDKRDWLNKYLLNKLRSIGES